MKASVLLLLCVSLAACAPREISILESRLKSDPERYGDWTVRVHLRGGVELVPEDSVLRAGGPVLRLQPTGHKDPVVSCAVEWGFAGGMPSSIAGPGGTPFKRVPIHRVNHVVELAEFEFSEDHLIAWVPVPDGAGHRYFARQPGIECALRGACTCIHPGYRQLNEGFWIVVPQELIYRFSGRSPESVPDGSSVVSERRTGGWMGSGLGLPRPGGKLDAPGWALRRAASGQDSLALADLQASITEITRNQVITHDALLDHFMALMLIRAARGENEAAANAAAHLMHFQEIELDLDAPPAPDTPLADFFATRGIELRDRWPEFVAWMAERTADCLQYAH